MAAGLFAFRGNLDPSKKSRRKSSDLDDRAVLGVCLAYTDHGSTEPPGHPLFDTFPRKVVFSKLDKLRERGFITREGKITKAGRAFLNEAAA